MSTPIPRLNGWPIVGSLAAFRTRRLQLFEQVRLVCGPIGSFSIGPWSLVLLNDPALIQRVFVDHADQVRRPDRLRDLLFPAIGNGLLNSDGALHRRQRRLIAPTLQPRHIRTYAASMTDATVSIQQTWADGAQIALDQELLQLTLRVIGATLFGAEVHTEAPTVAAALATMHDCVNQAVSALLPVPTAWPTPANARYRRAVAQLDRIIEPMIHERRQRGGDRDDFLARLLAAQDEDDGSFMNARQVRDEAMTFFSAGHETTATTLSWTWYLLLQHPAIYDRLQHEVDQVVGQRRVTPADLPQLPTTTQVIKEALRLYPPAYLIVRTVTAPIDLGVYRLTPGMHVGISPYALHRDPQFFPAPDRFDPERFTPQAALPIPQHAFLPFGLGPHTCIGSHFALMEAQIVLATLAQHVTFELLPQPPIRPQPLVTLRPDRAIQVRVRRRARQGSSDSSA